MKDIRGLEGRAAINPKVSHLRPMVHDPKGHRTPLCFRCEESEGQGSGSRG